jgi:hypothetical protein
MKRVIFKSVFWISFIAIICIIDAQSIKATVDPPKCGYDLIINGQSMWVNCKREWCPDLYMYDGCTTNGNGPDCNTKKLCPSS